MKIKINVVTIALILLIIAVSVLYYKERNMLDLIYILIVIAHLIRYVHNTTN